jgi:hypothetical protein
MEKSRIVCKKWEVNPVQTMEPPNHVSAIEISGVTNG